MNKQRYPIPIFEFAKLPACAVSSIFGECSCYQTLLIMNNVPRRFQVIYTSNGQVNILFRGSKNAFRCRYDSIYLLESQITKCGQSTTVYPKYKVRKVSILIRSSRMWRSAYSALTALKGGNIQINWTLHQKLAYAWETMPKYLSRPRSVRVDTEGCRWYRLSHNIYSHKRSN